MPWQTPTGTIDGTTPPTLATVGAVFDELVTVDRYVQLSGIDYTPPGGASAIAFLWVVPTTAQVRVKARTSHDSTWTGWYVPVSDGGTLPVLTLSAPMYCEWLIADRLLLARGIDYEQTDATHVQLLAPLAAGAVLRVAHHTTPQSTGWERPRGAIIAGVVPDLLSSAPISGEEIYAVDRLVQIHGVDYAPDGTTDLGQINTLPIDAILALLYDAAVNPGSDSAGALVHLRKIPGDAVSKILQQYRDATTPGVREEVQTNAAEVQQVEDALWTIIDNTALDSPTTLGVNLDRIGKLIGQPRGGLSDDDYLLWLKARILVNRSSGSIDDILTIFMLINPAAVPLFVEQYPAAFALKVNGISVLAPSIQAAILKVARKAGVRGVLEYSTAPTGSGFCFAGGVGKGFPDASLTPGSGGKLAGAAI